MSETLVVLVILCVPFFLCVKPCIALCCGEPHDEEKAGAHEGEVAAEEALVAADE